MRWMTTRITLATTHRILRLLEKAGPMGLTVQEFARQFWEVRRCGKVPASHRTAGRMLCELVDRGFASRIDGSRGGANNAVHVLQEPGRRFLEDLARQEAAQAEAAAARFGAQASGAAEDPKERATSWDW